MTFGEFLAILIFGFPFLVFLTCLPVWIFNEFLIRKIQ